MGLIRTVLAVLLSALTAGAQQPAPPHGVAEHVVVIVWDGMRPEFLTAEYTPVLHALAKSGVVFSNHHSIYPTSTEVNGTALATGVFPNRSGIMANNEYRPDIEPAKAIPTQGDLAIARGDELTGGRYLTALTLAETLQAKGIRTAIAGTKAVARLHNRQPDASTKSAVVSEGRSFPPDAVNSAMEPFPFEIQFPNNGRDTWTTRALTESLWKDGVPKFSFLWLSEPDASQHNSAPGMELALAGLKSSDDCLALVLRALEAKGVREKTDVIVVSDHGFSTIQRSIDLPALLTSEGFRAFSEFKAPPQTGDVMCVGNGGTILCYVIGQDRDVTARLIEFLQKTDFVGALFTREPAPGTFPLSEVRLDTKAPPDVVISLRWTDGKNQAGVPGLIGADWNRGPGKGTHATFSRFDVHNTLTAAGPDFKAGVTSHLLTQNVDVTATVLWILGVEPAQPLDGRALLEAMKGIQIKMPAPQTSEIVAERTFETGTWRQYLKITKLGERTYFEEANGEFTPK